jgi:hypothetical protein
MTTQLTHQGTRPRTTASATLAGRGPVREALHRIQLTIQEMNYSSRRVVELQAPWSVDSQWHRK